jgi:hypothetical protein
MGVISVGNVFAEVQMQTELVYYPPYFDCTLEERPQFDRYYEYGSELKISILNPNPNICAYTLEYYDSEKNFLIMEKEEPQFVHEIIAEFDQQWWPEGEYFISLKSVTDGKSNGHYPLTIKVAPTDIFEEEPDNVLEDYTIFYNETTYSPSADTLIRILNIEGKLPPSEIPNPVIFKIIDPSGNVSFIDQIFPNQYGYFNTSLQLAEGEGFSKNGTYTTLLTWELNGEETEWEFEFTVDDTSTSDGINSVEPQTSREPVDSLGIVIGLFTLIVIALIIMWIYKKKSSKDKSKSTKQCENCRGNWISVGTICEYCERMFNLPDNERIRSSTNPYDILGISRNSSQDEIRSAYHKLIKKYDPSFGSVNRTKEEQEIFEKIGVKLHLAWEQLKRK